jgi:glyoxylase-like metal-dependent hydrolase (beta-lactamase superfamily II)
MQTPEIRAHADGIHAIDTGFVRPGLAASYLLLRDGRAAFVDTGTSRSVPALLAALADLGVARERVDYVILTHVHLDHAGGAGGLMQALPGAIAVVHPRGAPHLADPAKLEAGSRAVYGDRAYDEHYGRLIPIPEARIQAVADSEVLLLGSSRLRVVETPGHALHHVAIHDETADAVFSGDAFGISYRAFDSPEAAAFIFATSSPTQFDPEQSHASIERIRTLAPKAVYLGHFGPVTEVEQLADDLHRDLDRFVAIAAAEATPGGPEAEERTYQAMRKHIAGRLSARGTSVDPETAESWLAMDARLNAAGLLAWQGRLARERQRQS